MGNEQASRVVQAPDITTNQGESAKPSIVRYNVGDENVELFLAKVNENSIPKHHVRQVFKSFHRSGQSSPEPPKNVTFV